MRSLICYVTLPFSLLCNAFILSTAVTFLCVVAWGCAFLPSEIDRLFESQKERAVFCELLPDKKSVISLMALMGQERFASGRTQRILWHDLRQTFQAKHIVGGKQNPICFALDPDGSRLFIGNSSGALTIANVDTPSDANEVQLGHMAKGFPSRMECAKDGKSLLILNNYGLDVWSIDSGRDDHGYLRWHVADPLIDCFATCPDSEAGVYCRFSHGHSQLIEFDIQTGNIHPILLDFPSRLKAITISRDGLLLAGIEDCDVFAGIEDSRNVVLLHRHSTQEPWTVRTIPGLCTGVTSVARFSPSGELFVTTDRKSRSLVVWDLEHKEIRVAFDMNSKAIHGCDFLNENELMSFCWDDKLRFWDLQSLSLVREFRL